MMHVRRGLRRSEGLWTRVWVGLALVVCGASLILGCNGRGKPANPTPEAAPDGVKQQATLKAPPIPEAGRLAAPRSLRQVGVPERATRAAIPPDNPQTADKIALGEKLFFDGRLSADGTVACSTCHDPNRAFTDGRPASIGIEGRAGQRNAPTILNALYNKTQFWDGRAKTLEEQAALPIINSIEMGQPSLDAAVAQIAAIGEYQQAFRRVFGRQPNGPDLLRAIASYERTQLSFDSPFDHFIAGDANAIDAAAKRGWELFNTRGRCNKCHALTDDKRDVTNFKDDDFHNIGIGIIRHDVVALARQAEKLINSGDSGAIDRAAIQTDMSALGRFLISKKESDIASFKTPELAQCDGHGAILPRRLARDALGRGGPLQQGRRVAESLSRPRHSTACSDGSGHRRFGRVHGVANERGLQGTGDQRAGASARNLSNEAAAARHGEGLRPESASPCATPTVTQRVVSWSRRRCAFFDDGGGSYDVVGGLRVALMCERARLRTERTAGAFLFSEFGRPVRSRLWARRQEGCHENREVACGPFRCRGVWCRAAGGACAGGGGVWDGCGFERDIERWCLESS